MPIRNRYLLFATSLTGVAWSTAAFGQDDAAAPVQSGTDIVVTATRQSQVLSKVPLSVAAYDQKSLDQQGVRRVDDIAQLTPGITFQRGDQRNASAATIAIRGISSTAGSATTGIYIDDTPIQIRTIGFSAFTPFPAVFDLQRVEVLRGPQGTLFGAGSEGGTVRFITPSPDFNALKLYARAELATTEQGAASYEGGAAVSVPLVQDKLAVRVSGYYRRDGGYIDRVNYRTGNVLDKNANWSNVKVVNAALAWKPVDAVTVTPSVYYQNGYTNDTGTYWEDLSNADQGKFRNGNALSDWNRDKFVLPALKIEADLGAVELVSNTSYFYRDQLAQNDYSVFESALWTGNPYYPAGMFAPATQYNKQSNVTQEVRLQSNNPDSRLTWVIGGFYTRNKQTARQYVQDTFLPGLFLAATGVPFELAFGQGLYQGKYTFVLDKATSIDEQIAGFGQADLKLTDKLKLTAGVRVAHTKLNASAQFVGPVVGPPINDSGHQSESPVTPKFGLSYQATGNTLVYASASKGYRVGGYNPAVGLPCGVSSSPVAGTALGNLGLTNRPELFDSDSVWSYEVGTKTRLFDRRLQFDASAFRIDWNNIQQTIQLTQCGFNYTANLGKARSTGFDIQFQLRATDSLTLGGAVGYTDAKFTQTIKAGPAAAANLVTAGDKIPLNPWQITFNGQYDFAVAGKDAYIRADFQHLSRQTGATQQRDPANGGADLTIPGIPETNNLSLRAGVTLEPVELSFFVNNVTNDRPLLLRQHDVVYSTLYRNATARPRTFGMTAIVRY